MARWSWNRHAALRGSVSPTSSGALAGIDCQLGDPAVKRVRAYLFRERSDMLEAYFSRLEQVGLDRAVEQVVPRLQHVEFTERRGPGRATDQRGRRLRHAEMLLDVHARLAALDSLDEALEELVTITSRETGADRVTLFLNDEETGELVFVLVSVGKGSITTGSVDPQAVGGALFGPYLLGVELASMLLLAGLVGTYQLLGVMNDGQVISEQF